MKMRTVGLHVLAILLLSGCGLYSEVAVQPLHLLPTDIERGADIEGSVRRADFLRAVELAPVADGRTRPNANELAALGEAFLACGRYDEARTRLRAALDLKPFHTTYAQIAWNLSQVEYLDNNYTSSLEWAKLASQNGLSIRQWHLDYLESLSGVPVYRFRGATTARLPLRFGRPSVPRLDVKVNGGHEAEAIIDSGAVLSIVSQRLADRLQPKSLGDFEGTFYGLLGEPIQVRFALLDSLEIGDIVVENVPVAIMPDEKMRFLITEKEKREFRMDFLLGVNLLKEFRIGLDFDSNRAHFTRLGARDRQPAADQNLFMAGFRPLVQGTINRRGWFLFVLDTGSEITFLNETQMFRLPIAQLGPRTHNATLQGLGGAKKSGAKIEDVQIGIDRWAGVFKTLPMYAAEERENSAGILGENFLRHFNVTIDFGRMRLDLVRR